MRMRLIMHYKGLGNIFPAYLLGITSLDSICMLLCLNVAFQHAELGAHLFLYRPEKKGCQLELAHALQQRNRLQVKVITPGRPTLGTWGS